MNFHFGPDEEGDCDGKFVKRYRKIENGFIFPEKEDIASVSRNHMIRRLPGPQPTAQTKRLCSVLKLNAELS